MKTTVQVPITTKTFESVEVEFPIYRKVETKGLFVRVDMMGTNMRESSVKFGKNGTITLKVDSEYEFEDADVDYLLGQEEYTSSKAEFEEALGKVGELVAVLLAK